VQNKIKTQRDILIPFCTDEMLFEVDEPIEKNFVFYGGIRERTFIRDFSCGNIWI